VGKALFWINGGIEGFDVMHLCKLCIIMQNLAGGRNKSNLVMIVKLLLIKVLKGQSQRKQNLQIVLLRWLA
jgi:hypothetical protein